MYFHQIKTRSFHFWFRKTNFWHLWRGQFIQTNYKTASSNSCNEDNPGTSEKQLAIFAGSSLVKFRTRPMKRIVLSHASAATSRHPTSAGANWPPKKWLWFIKRFVIGKLGRAWCVSKIGWSGQNMEGILLSLLELHYAASSVASLWDDCKSRFSWSAR